MNPRSQGFSRCWDFHDSSLRLPWMEIEWLFKIAVSTSRSGMFSAFADVYGCWIGQETRNGAWMRPAVVTWHRTGCSFPQFSRQPLIPFESRFVFPDRYDTHDRSQRPKPSRGANQRRRFSGCPSSCSCSNFSRKFPIISATYCPFWALFRESGPIQHQ